MTQLQRLCIRILITIALYIILTIPYITKLFFDFGIDYGKTGIMIVSLATIVLAPFVQKLLKLDS